MRPWPLLIGFAACGGMSDPSTVEQQEGACIALEGRRFQSVNELECGRTPDGVALCRWTLTVTSRDDASSSFQWSYSDVGESGQLECHGATVTSVGGMRAISGTFDAATQKLVWHGETYTLAPAP
ncbi:MAG: hypothetical protein H0T89_05155 [Deltaproteobacteria bacterium]|nr:hypothetical protein [Deltaproteobacteria bacterium]MDQ3295533.1 hypothetical protein [Myxococcota bacterium]